MAYLETILPKGGSAGKVFDFKMADNVNKAPVSKKVKQEWLEEDIEKLVTLWSEEKVLYRCRHKDYLKRCSRGKIQTEQVVHDFVVS